LDKDKSNMLYILKRLMKYSKNKYCVLLFVFAAVLGSIIEILMANPLKNMTDMMLNGQSGRLWNQIYIILILLPIGAISKYLGNYLIAKFGTKTLENLRMKLANHALNLPIKSIEEKNSSRIVACLTNDIPLIQEFLTNTFPNMILQPVLFISVFTYLFILNYKLILFSMISIPGILIFNLILSKSIARNSAQLQEQWTGINSILSDAISGINVIKAFNLNRDMYNKYKTSVNNVLQKSLQIELRISWMSPLSFVIRVIPRIMCIAYGGYLVINGELSMGALLAYIYLFNFLITPASSIPKLISDFLTSTKILSRIFEIFDIPLQQDFNNTTQTTGLLKICDPIIEFRNVTFSYDDKIKTLKNINMHIVKGSMIALVGESGSGKSTIFKLLCSFYQPQEGTIKLLGNEINQNSLINIRDYISLVTQENFLFPMSINDNIALAKQDATKDEIISASKAANIHDFIMSLPKGYDTLIEEKGGNLSGGQRQRICIARSILKKSPIILFDEPTSALDTESESQIKKTFENLRKDRTILVIAHRLSTISNADTIYVLNDGNIVESGSHNELLALSGYYKKLYMNKLVTKS